MEDHVRPIRNRGACRGVVGNIGAHGFDVSGKTFRPLRCAHVEQREPLERPIIERLRGDQTRRQLAPDHPGGAGDKDMHRLEPNRSSVPDYSAMPPSTR